MITLSVVLGPPLKLAKNATLPEVDDLISKVPVDRLLLNTALLPTNKLPAMPAPPNAIKPPEPSEVASAIFSANNKPCASKLCLTVVNPKLEPMVILLAEPKIFADKTLALNMFMSV
jgi:hypothetical protein